MTSVWLASAALAGAVLAFPGCGPKAKDDSPVGVTRRLAQAVNDRDNEAAFSLLGPSTRARLAAAAERANKLGGEKGRLTAKDMLSLAWRAEADPDWKPKAFKLVRAEGNSAQVEVSGAKKGQRALVRLVRVKGEWRVELELPPPQP